MARLKRKLERSGNLGELALSRGLKRYLRIEGDARIDLDEKKIAEDERWDGLAGVQTDIRDLEAEDLLVHYHGLWQVEQSFRIVKHDLRMRPIFHWMPGHIQAHAAICFMAYACVRRLAYRTSIQKRRMSPERIRDALKARYDTVFQCERTGCRYSVPWGLEQDTKDNYAAMGLPLRTKPSIAS